LFQKGPAGWLPRGEEEKKKKKKKKRRRERILLDMADSFGSRK
jgi:hypothetical protein